MDGKGGIWGEVKGMECEGEDVRIGGDSWVVQNVAVDSDLVGRGTRLRL